MKKYLTLLITVLALSLLASGAVSAHCIGYPPYYGHTKIVKVDQTFRIALPSNPTTGYSWRANFDPDYIELVDSTYIPYPVYPRIVGSGGIQIFTFKAINSGRTAITMEYQRPWAETVPPLKTVRYNILILKSPILM